MCVCVCLCVCVFMCVCLCVCIDNTNGGSLTLNPKFHILFTVKHFPYLFYNILLRSRIKLVKYIVNKYNLACKYIIN